MNRHEQPLASSENQPDWPELPESVEAAKDSAAARAQALVAAYETGGGDMIEAAEASLSQALDDIQEMAGVDAVLEYLDFLTQNHLSNS